MTTGLITFERLKKRADFLRVTRARCSVGMPGLVLQACPFPKGIRLASMQGEPYSTETDAGDGDGARIGFTASKKVGNAVARNRAKRRLRALTAEVMTQHAQPGRDYVLIARQSTPTRSYKALRADLEKALKRLKLWREE